MANSFQYNNGCTATTFCSVRTLETNQFQDLVHALVVISVQDFGRDCVPHRDGVGGIIVKAGDKDGDQRFRETTR